MSLDPRGFYERPIHHALTDMADDYQRIADALRRIATDVPEIGEKRGLGTIAATGIATEALGCIFRSTPSPVRLVAAAADYERHVAARPTEET